jgi:hypothetical protein
VFLKPIEPAVDKMINQVRQGAPVEIRAEVPGPSGPRLHPVGRVLPDPPSRRAPLPEPR